MSIRRIALFLGLLVLVTCVVYLAYNSELVRGWFAKDTENPVELAKLAKSELGIAPAADSTTGWPQWRGPLRDGRAPLSPFRTNWDKSPPKLLWSTPCGGSFSSMAVVGGKLFTQDRQGNNERVFCLGTTDGKQLWEYVYATGSAGKDPKYAIGPRATPTVQGNLVYTVGGSGKLLCLEMQPNGNSVIPRWQHDLLEEFTAQIPEWGVACSPLLEGDLAIVQPGGKDASVVAFDKTTGELHWHAGSDPSGYSSPIAGTIGGQRAIFALTSNSLLALTVDGRVTDRYPWPTRFSGNAATPLIVDEYVFISAAYTQGCALLRAQRIDDRVKLVQVYARNRSGMQNHHSTSVYKDRYVYGFDGDTVARLKCVEFDTGREKPDWDAAEVRKGSLILADKYLIIQTERGELCLVEATPEEFRLVAKIPKVLSGSDNWASPSLVDGRLYLRDEQKVVCYDVRPE